MLKLFKKNLHKTRTKIINNRHNGRDSHTWGIVQTNLCQQKKIESLKIRDCRIIEMRVGLPLDTIKKRKSIVNHKKIRPYLSYNFFFGVHRDEVEPGRIC